MSTPIEDAVNIGPKLGAELRAAGISTIDELGTIGYVDATRRLRAAAPDRGCVHAGIALAGAIKEVQSSLLAADDRARLRAHLIEELAR